MADDILGGHGNGVKPLDGTTNMKIDRNIKNKDDGISMIANGVTLWQEGGKLLLWS